MNKTISRMMKLSQSSQKSQASYLSRHRSEFRQEGKIIITYSSQGILEQYYGYQFPIVIEDLDGSLIYRSKSSADDKLIFDSNNISIYPNPANDVINVYYSKHSLQDIEFEIVGIEGRSKFDQYYPGKNNSWSIDISSLNPSIYTLVMRKDGKKIESIKFIKN